MQSDRRRWLQPMSNDRRSELAEHQKEFLLELGELFKMFRVSAGLTHKQAANFVPMSTGKISNLENGKTDVGVLSLQKWAAAYGYHVEIGFIPFEEDSDGEVGGLQEEQMPAL